jgi:uncharacterized protein YecA (UPF0149 family)
MAVQEVAMSSGNDASREVVSSYSHLYRDVAAAPVPVMSKPTQAQTKVGRNDECPCGSGKKFKKCHGKKGQQ